MAVRIDIPWKSGGKGQWRDRVVTHKRNVDEENAFVDIRGRL